jgi:penicillin-insensitive murein endopeptidase
VVPSPSRDHHGAGVGTEAPIRALFALLLLAALPAEAQVLRPWGEPWARAPGPLPGPPRIHGGSAAGCIAGAERLPAEGPHWQAVRVSRNRHWGHPALLEAIAGLAERARAAGLGALWVGDMGQPRGGPMPWGHASHQNGLDVDIWFDIAPKPPSRAAEREQIEVPSLVSGEAVDPARWQPGHATLIRLAALTPGADRVLVNPAIKRELCRMAGGAEWLRRVRPWWGHDQHLHLRLRCPRGQEDCLDLAPPPPGDGCDASLDWWFSAAARAPAPSPPRPPQPPRLPLACEAVLRAGQSR